MTSDQTKASLTPFSFIKKTPNQVSIIFAANEYFCASRKDRMLIGHSDRVGWRSWVGAFWLAPQHPFRSREKKRKYFPIPFNGKPVSFARSFSVFFFSIRPPSGARLHLPNAPFRRLGASCMLMLFPFLPSNVNLPPSMSIHWKDPPSPDSFFPSGKRPYRRRSRPRRPFHRIDVGSGVVFFYRQHRARIPCRFSFLVNRPLVVAGWGEGRQ